MRSRERAAQGRWRWLAAKECRELAASRAGLLFAIALGPLVAHAFTTAVETYAEASGAGGGTAALAQGLSPLDGIVVPTFGAYAIASTLLFPFVAIRLLSVEKESGALRLLLQSRARLWEMIAIKLAVLVVAWVLSWLPGFFALALWRWHGGHLQAAEVTVVLVGYLLRGLLVTALALASAAVTESAASAAVVTLALTLGTWALDFVAQVRGGTALAVARFTPDAVIRVFERGELRLDIVCVTLVVTMMLFALAVVWLRPATTGRWRAVTTASVGAIGLFAALAASRLRTSWDLSEDRRNSFAASDERALRAIREPIEIRVHLAPEDPRLADLERSVLRKLRRTAHDLRIVYVARGSTGLFERPGEHYGEVWYRVGAREEMSRSTTEPIVLETIYELARVPTPTRDSSSTYPGYPLAARSFSAGLILYAAWPLAILLTWWGRRWIGSP